MGESGRNEGKGKRRFSRLLVLTIVFRFDTGEPREPASGDLGAFEGRSKLSLGGLDRTFGLDCHLRGVHMVEEYFVGVARSLVTFCGELASSYRFLIFSGDGVNGSRYLDGEELTSK